jgi:hypothetical protein
VPRDRCSDYDVSHSFWAFPAKQAIIAVAQRSLLFLRPFVQEDLVVMALIQDIDEKKDVEVSKEAWPLVSAGVDSVTIALESGASPIVFGESGARLGLYGVLRSPGGRPAQF